MGSKRIKVPKERKPRVHGYRQDKNLQAMKSQRTQRILREQARSRRMTKVDGETGETYILARLIIKDNNMKGEYKKGLDKALGQVVVTAEAQAEAIRAYLQAWVDDGRLVPVSCFPQEKPACRIYQGENRRVVVIRQDQLP